METEPNVTCIRRPHTTWTTCPCPTCNIDRRRMHKRARAGLYKRVPTEQAQTVLRELRDAGWTAHAIASACGLHYRSVDRDMNSVRIGAKIAAKIINYGDPTEGSVGSVGTMRRLQGLARQGYDLQTIADATGIRFSTLAAIRNGVTARVKATFYTTIRDYTNSVGVKVGPSTLAQKQAETKQWPGILAWDDIDDRHEQADIAPKYVPHNDPYDEAAVIRILNGERCPSRKPDRDEAMRRWLEMGRRRGVLEELMNWNPGRYGRAA